MKTHFFLFIAFIHLLLLPGCDKNKPKAICKQEYLRDCVIVKIKKIKPEIQVVCDREKIMDAGFSIRTIMYKIHRADAVRRFKTVKEMEQFVIKGRDGKNYRLSEFADIHLRINVSYEYPWGSNPFNIE